MSTYRTQGRGSRHHQRPPNAPTPPRRTYDALLDQPHTALSEPRHEPTDPFAVVHHQQQTPRVVQSMPEPPSQPRPVPDQLVGQQLDDSQKIRVNGRPDLRSHRS